jgi:hypothetical protein
MGAAIDEREAEYRPSKTGPERHAQSALEKVTNAVEKDLRRLARPQ